MTPEDIPAEVFAGRPHRLTMGLRPLDMATWLDPDPDDPQRALRAQLLREHRDAVYGLVPGSEAAATAAARAVGVWVGAPLGTDEPPLVAAAQLVRDDLAVLVRRDGGWLLGGAVVCFPSQWVLAEKLGTDVLAVHDPVPRYREQLGKPTVAVLDRLRADAPRWRVNWTLRADGELFLPTASGKRHVVGQRSWLRVERQTLVRLPEGEVIVFGIRTTVKPLEQLSAPQREAVLASARQTPRDIADYRGWGE